MCGRAAQTITTVRNAALLLNATMDDGSKDDAHNNDNNNNSNHLNKSPGQTFTVFTVKTGTSTEKDCHYSSSSSVKSQPQTKTTLLQKCSTFKNILKSKKKCGTVQRQILNQLI